MPQRLESQKAQKGGFLVSPPSLSYLTTMGGRNWSSPR